MTESVSYSAPAGAAVQEPPPTAKVVRPALRRPPEERPARETQATRLVSLDAFRGLTIAGMLVVNNLALGAAAPAQLVHASWNRGVHFADLVFPWFLLIAGVSLPYSAASHRAKGGSGWGWAAKAVRRGMLLILLGWLVDSSIAHTPVLGLGVLQLIGLASLVGAMAYLLPWRWRGAIAAVLLVGQWAALRFVPAPGIGAGQFGESANLVQYVDTYLRPLHLRGLLSVIPTGALVLIGTLEGDLLRARKRPVVTAAMLAGAGVVLTGAALAWSLSFPFNKPLWTGSYIVLAAGLGTMLLSAMHLAAEGLGRREWAFPPAVFGQNAILAYVAPILTKVYVLQGWSWGTGRQAVSLQDTYLTYLRAHSDGIAAGWLYTASYLAVWWLILLYLHRRGMLLRV